MGQITGGSVTFGRTVQPAQYESKKAEVTMTFVCAEDDTPAMWEEMLNGASAMARDKALELVGVKAAVEPKRASAAEPLGDVPAKPTKKTGKAQTVAPPAHEETVDLGSSRDKAAEQANEARHSALRADGSPF